MHSKELPNLDTFAEAAERGSFTAAARTLGISQAAVSQRIQQLETALGVSLFQRESGRVTLTDHGRRLHDYARKILALTGEAWAAVTGKPDDVTGEVLIAASSVPSEHLLARALADFRSRYPNVQVRVSVSDTQEVLREVEQGEAHLGLVGDQRGGPSLEYRKFASDELVLVVPKSHPWRKKERVTANELATQPFVHREAGSGSRRVLERSLEHIGIRPSSLNVVLELGTNEAVKEAVLAGLGIAALSKRSVQREIETGQLRTLKVNRLSLDRDIYVVRDRRRALPAPADLFLQFLKPEPASRS